MKRCTPSCVRGNVDYNKSKILLHTYLNGQNLEHWQHQMLTRMWCNGPGRGGKCKQCWRECRMAATLEDRLAASYKTKQTPVIWHTCAYTPITKIRGPSTGRKDKIEPNTSLVIQTSPPWTLETHAWMLKSTGYSKRDHNQKVVQGLRFHLPVGGVQFDS